MSGTERNDLETWEEMVSLEPELEKLRVEFHAWAAKNRDEFADTDAWQRWLKPSLRGLVGWYSKWPRGHWMASGRAWETAHTHIYTQAPIPVWDDRFADEK